MDKQRVERVVARYLAARLNPPLGEPGGPCQVIRRIKDEIRNPRLREQLTDEVEHGKSLSNQMASKVYDLEREQGIAFAKQIEISSHAQYRMDLRSVTVSDVKAALRDFATMLERFRSIKPSEHQRLTSALAYGDDIPFTSRDGLKLVFTMRGPVAKIITTFWKGVPDPAAPQGCRL